MKKKNLQERMHAISSAYSELSKSHLDYVKFYKDNHSSIPTWIMVKVINFSSFINILNNSKKEVLHSICKLYGMYNEDELYNVKLLIGSLHWMRKIRNSCAHNERVYKRNERRTRHSDGRIKEYYFNQLGASYLREKDKSIMDLLVYLKYYLSNSE